jgi:hypothetical protein
MIVDVVDAAVTHKMAATTLAERKTRQFPEVTGGTSKMTR